jgi:hypothetical protein
MRPLHFHYLEVVPLPSPDYVILRARPHTCHLKHLLGSKPHAIPIVKSPEAQPDHPTVLLNSEVASEWLGGIRLRNYDWSFNSYHLLTFQKCKLISNDIHSTILLPREYWFLILLQPGDGGLRIRNLIEPTLFWVLQLMSLFYFLKHE